MHVMIDLETMGTRPTAPIIAIGAVTFDGEEINDTFYANVDLQSSVDSGAVVDPKTVMWWMQQSDDARGALIASANLVELSVALDRFSSWLPKGIGGVWGNGASFDNVILSESYRRLNLTPPWPFWADRCYRTMKNMHPDVEMERNGTHHNAVDDAKSQAKHMMAINQASGGLFL